MNIIYMKTFKILIGTIITFLIIFLVFDSQYRFDQRSFTIEYLTMNYGL